MLSLLNAFLIAVMIGLNVYFQGFCIPTDWAVVLLSICFVNTIFYPFLGKTSLAPMVSFINGVSVILYIYCIIFLEHFNFHCLLMIIVGIGLFVFIPHFFVVQLIRNSIYKTTRKYFYSAIILCIVAVIYVGIRYNKAIDSIERFKASNYQELEKNFMTEKILGMHFIFTHS